MLKIRFKNKDVKWYPIKITIIDLERRLEEKEDVIKEKDKEIKQFR